MAKNINDGDQVQNICQTSRHTLSYSVLSGHYQWPHGCCWDPDGHFMPLFAVGHLASRRPSSCLALCLTIQCPGRIGRMSPQNHRCPMETCHFRHGNPCACAFSLAVNFGCCVNICGAVELELWALRYLIKRTRYSQTSHQLEMEYPRLTLHRKTLIKGLTGLGNSKLPCGIDDFRLLATDAGLLLLSSWALGIVPVVLKKLTDLEMG